MVEKGMLIEQDISVDEIIESQKLNITSKKYRQTKRIRISRMVGITVPQWDELPPSNGSYFTEIRVLLGKFKARFLQALKRVFLHGNAV